MTTDHRNPSTQISPLGRPLLPELGADGVPIAYITGEVFWAIGRTIGSLSPETGGILGTRRGEFVVSDFHYDSAGSCSHSTYAPDVDTINSLLSGAWERESPSIDLVGCIHSHPSGVGSLSRPDLRYISRLLELNEHLGAFFAPLVLPDRQQLVSWFVYRDRPWEPVRARLEVL